MMLQLAVGPPCILVFQIAANRGFLLGLCMVLAIALGDALFILLACLGAAALLNKPGVKTVLKVIGSLVLVLFGADMVLSAFSLSFLPVFTNASALSPDNLFLQGFLLTLSNPLTILFWGGMFSTQVLQNNWNRPKLFLFAFGCVLSTVLALTFAAILGSVLKTFLPEKVITGLNVAVGIALIFFGIRMLLKKDKNP